MTNELAIKIAEADLTLEQLQFLKIIVDLKLEVIE